MKTARNEAGYGLMYFNKQTLVFYADETLKTSLQVITAEEKLCFVHSLLFSLLSAFFFVTWSNYSSSIINRNRSETFIFGSPPKDQPST